MTDLISSLSPNTKSVPGSIAESFPPSSSQSIDFIELEGFALVFLCSPSGPVRVAVLSLLHEISEFCVRVSPLRSLPSLSPLADAEPLLTMLRVDEVLIEMGRSPSINSFCHY